MNTHSKPTRVWVEHGSRHCTLERRIFMFAGWFVSSNSGLSPLVDHSSLTPMAIWRVFFPYFETDPLRNLRGRLQFIVKKLPLVDNDLGDSPVFDIGHVHVALMTFQIHGIHSSYWGIFDVSYVSLCNLLDIHLRGKYTYTAWPASGNSLCFGKCSSQSQSKLYIKTRIRIGGPERVWNTQRVNPTSLYHPIPLWRSDGKMNAQRSTNSGNNRGNWPWDHGNLGGPGCGYLKTP